MPNRQHFESIVDDSVVQPVPDSLHPEATNARLTGLRNKGAHARLLQEKTQRLLEFLAHGSGSSRPIGGPPPDNTFDFTRRPAGNTKLKRHRYS